MTLSARLQMLAAIPPDELRARLKNPPYIEDYLATLTWQGLLVTVAELEQFAELL